MATYNKFISGTYVPQLRLYISSKNPYHKSLSLPSLSAKQRVGAYYFSVTWFSWETKNATVSFFVRVCVGTKWASWSQAFPAESVEPGDKCGGVTRAMHSKIRKY